MDFKEDEIYDTGQEILQIINEVYAEANIELPTRQFVMAADSVHDCEQVSVSFMGLASGLPQQQPAPNGCEGPANVTFLVEIARDLPLSKRGKNTASVIPSVDDIQRTSRIQLTDARLLAEVGWRVGLSNWFSQSFYGVSAGPDSGKMQAMILEINVAL